MQRCRTGAANGGVAVISACVVYCTEESVWRVFTKMIGVEQLLICEVRIVVCNIVLISDGRVIVGPFQTLWEFAS